MGGECSKFIRLEPDAPSGDMGIVDYETDGVCAAGTGSFIDQQATRLRYRVEEIGDLVMEAEPAARIAGRCSVFAKSDMVHAQQKGFTPPQIFKGLCDAVARNFKSSITKGKRVKPRVAFIGGQAANRGVAQSLKGSFRFNDEEFFVPECYAWVGAIGAAAVCRSTSPPGAHQSRPRTLRGLTGS
jgi:activator of 2-hydroxyglutaryl-CoA dehydratase